MAETLEAPQVITPETQETTITAPPADTPFTETSDFKNAMAAKFGENVEPTAEETHQNTTEEKAYYQELGFETPEDFTTEWESLKALKNQPKGSDIELDDEARALIMAIKEGKGDDVVKILDTKKQLSNAANLDADAAIKLHLQLTNKHYKKEDVEDVFDEKYGIPKEPIQRSLEDEDEFEERHNEWEVKRDKVKRAIERDAVTAKEALAKISTEIKIPQIDTHSDKDYEDYKASLAKSSDTINNVINPAIEAVNEKDLVKAIKVLDAKNQMDFSVKITPEKEDFAKAKNMAVNVIDFLRELTFNAKGEVTPNELIDMVLWYSNKDKYIQSAARQAVNAERSRVVNTDTTSGFTGGRSYSPSMEKSDFQKAMDAKLGGY